MIRIRIFGMNIDRINRLYVRCTPPWACSSCAYWRILLWHVSDMHMRSKFDLFLKYKSSVFESNLYDWYFVLSFSFLFSVSRIWFISFLTILTKNQSLSKFWAIFFKKSSLFVTIAIEKFMTKCDFFIGNLNKSFAFWWTFFFRWIMVILNRKIDKNIIHSLKRANRRSIVFVWKIVFRTEWFVITINGSSSKY